MGLPTLRQIRKAYEKTGLKPTTQRWFHNIPIALEDGSYSWEIEAACALGACAIAESSLDNAKTASETYSGSSRFVQNCPNLTDRELNSFVVGFDGGRFMRKHHDEAPFKRGRRARQALIESA